MDSFQLETNTNVYVLGAGFSTYAGIPMVRQFLGSMRESTPWNNARIGAADAIRKVLAFRLEASAAASRMPIDLENVEELFSLASTIPNESTETAIVQAIAATIDYAFSHRPEDVFAGPPMRAYGDSGFIASLPRSWAAQGTGHRRRDANGNETEEFHIRPPIYDLAIGLLLGLFDRPDPHSKNVVITLNYDLVLEYTLMQLGVPYRYWLNGDSVETAGCAWHPAVMPIDVLKLHGSVNWAKTGGRLVALPKYHNLRDEGLWPYLVPPTYRKQFDPQLGVVWNRAVGALESATRIVIIGYSMPATDAHFRYLLAAGLSKNVSLRSIVSINPDPTMETRVLPSVFRPELVAQGQLHALTCGLDSAIQHHQFPRLVGRSVGWPFDR